MAVLSEGRCVGVHDWTELPLDWQLMDCLACPVRAACLEATLAFERHQDISQIRHHVTAGGLTGGERARLLRAERCNA